MTIIDPVGIVKLIGQGLFAPANRCSTNFKTNLTGDYLWRSSVKIGAGKFRSIRPLLPLTLRSEV